MSSQRTKEGYLLIDNRFGPGVSEEFVRQSGKDAPTAGEGAMYESATYTCSHCHSVVIINPQRTREREYCSNCDHHICDGCAYTRKQNLQCVTMNQVMDVLQNQAGKE